MGKYPLTPLKAFQTPLLLPFTRHKQNTPLLLSISKHSSNTNDKFPNKLLLNTICLPSLILFIKRSVLFTLLFLPKPYYHKLKGEITLWDPLIKRGSHFIAFFLCDRHCYPSPPLSPSSKNQYRTGWHWCLLLNLHHHWNSLLLYTVRMQQCTMQ